MIRGETQYNAVSRFVKEIPEKLFEGRGPVRPSKEETVRKFEYSTPGAATRKIAPAKSAPSKPVVAPKPFIARATAFTSLKKGADISSQAAPDYGPGDRVSHMKFGAGTVLNIVKGARDYEVTVDFDGFGTKKMFAAFAKLSKI
jgi:DNA helicase-2/ATP-dependent DNA helicase PcrA